MIDMIFLLKTFFQSIKFKSLVVKEIGAMLLSDCHPPVGHSCTLQDDQLVHNCNCLTVLETALQLLVQ